MSRLRSRVLLAAGSSVLLLSSLAVADTTGATTEPEPPSATYTSTTFAIPFEVTAPDWVGAGTAPFAERPHFVTWATSTEPDRAVRFLAPTAVIQPPNATEIAMPDDYVAYLHSLVDYGVRFDDVVETTVDGRPATILTATTANEIGGALGC